jgi:glycosyltransferase involved in cell wall biosynthesis
LTEGQIEKYRNKINFFISEPDKGIFDAMNKGIDVCKGKYIGFLNAGDYYESNALSQLAANNQIGLDHGVIYGNTNLIIKLRNEVYSTKLKPKPKITEELLIAPMFCHQSSFVKQDLFRKVGYFDNVGIAGDWLHFVKLFRTEVSFKYFDITIANYLEGGASTSTAGFKESFKYKKEFKTFRFRDHIQLMLFRIKNFKPTKNLVNLIIWKTKIVLHSQRFKRIE